VLPRTATTPLSDLPPILSHQVCHSSTILYVHLFNPRLAAVPAIPLLSRQSFQTIPDELFHQTYHGYALDGGVLFQRPMELLIPDDKGLICSHSLAELQSSNPIIL